MTVVFYISGHGFGHASRDVEVINVFGARHPDVRLVIRSAASPTLLLRTLRVPYELRSGPCDSGVVQTSSVEHDDAATVREAVGFYAQFDAQVEAEAAALARDDVRVILGDIPPLASAVAARLGVPSVSMGNFTWDWIYETHPGLMDAAPWLPPLIRRAYGLSTHAWELPFAGGFEVFPAVRRLPLIARRPRQPPERTRAHFGVPEDRPAVLLSFGGYGIPQLDVSRVDCGDWTLVVTDRVVSLDPTVTPAHVVYVAERQFLGSEFRYEDLVAAVDVVMSKPGYGIVSECIACGVPLVYTSRGAFREYDVFVRDMPRYLRCAFMSHAQLFAGEWRAALEAARSLPPPPETIPCNGADVAAQELALIVRT